MTIAKARQFSSFEAYLAADPEQLPEGRYEYWDGELVAVMSESLENLAIADYLFVLLINAGIPLRLVKAGRVEVAVAGTPRTRFPDLVILREAHVPLLEKRATITRQMPPPLVLIEVVSPGNEASANYLRDYYDKPQQYAAIAVPEYWIVDPDRAVVKVGRLIDGAYHFQDFAGDAVIVSPMVPAFAITAAQVLRAGQ